MTLNSKILDFTMQAQQGPAWCWAAVSCSIALFYQRNSEWTQCKLATLTLKKQADSGDFEDCCENKNSETCQVPNFLIDTEGKKGAFITAKIPFEIIVGSLNIVELKSEIDNGRIIAFHLEIGLEREILIRPNIPGIKFFGHFVVIAGYEEVSESITDETFNVHVFDPYSLDGSVSVMSYKTFKTNYKCHGGFVPDRLNSPDKETYCKVTHSFLTKPIPSS